MFGGLTHEPAVAPRANGSSSCAPPASTAVFFCDSGSVSVEVAIKMALQYWRAADGRPHAAADLARRLPRRHVRRDERCATPTAACTRCSTDVLPQQVFAPRSPAGFDAARARRTRARALLAEHARRAGRGRSSSRSCRAPAACGSTTRATSQRPARAVRRARRAADLRRDRHRVRPHRELFAARARRRRAGHHVRRQGADRRLPDAGRDAVHRRRSPQTVTGRRAAAC